MRNIRTWGVVLPAVLGTFAVVLVVLVLWPDGDDDDDTPMGGMTNGNGEDAMAPPVAGFYDGEEISFIHTEASDQQVVEMLTGMMGSPVILVPALADVPEESRANVYVFTNGVRPDGAQGPLGFQPDVFDSAPGDDDYSPLRSINQVTWTDEESARLLRSVEEIIEAEQRGELTIERPGVVVNMPFLTWPGGQR
jgi:hypothetical protein